MKLKKIFFIKNRIWWGLFFIFTVFDQWANLYVSYILQRITDAALGNEVQPLITLGILCIVSLAVMLAISVGQYYTQTKFLNGAMLRYKNIVFNGVLQKSRRSFSMENTSTYISALTNDAATIENSYLLGTMQLIAYVISFMATFGMMVIYSPVLTLSSMLLAFIPVLISMLTGSRLAQDEKAVSWNNETFVGTVKDMLEGFSVIKSFRVEKEIGEIYQGENEKLERAKFRKNIVAGRIGLLSMTGGIVSQIGIFIIGAYLAVLGKGVTAGILIAFVNLLGILNTQIAVMPQLFAGRKAGLALIDKMEKAVIENTAKRTGKVPDGFYDGISVKNLSFGYTEETDVLKDISVKFEVGKSYAVVGSSGSGKSTLLDILMGNFDTYRGSIKYDGEEVKELDADVFYDLISVIQQNVFIFNGTIWDNVTMFREFPGEQVERAMEQAGLKNLVEEKGEDYICGENGCNLSGGERQRISIARCLLRRTPILAADEATASLDVKTAYEVAGAILDLKNIMRIVVTHQLEEDILRRYDVILVMKNGKIEEMGRFDELLERKRYFYSMYYCNKKY